MTIGYTAHTTVDGTVGTVITGTLTPNNGSNRGLLCIVRFLDATAGTTITSVEWDLAGSTQSLTEKIVKDAGGASRTRIAAIYALEGVDPGTTLKSWRVTFSQSVNSYSIEWISLNSVDQTSFVGVVTGTTRSVSNDGTVTLTPSSTAENIIFSAIMINVAGTLSFTPATDNNEITDSIVGSGGSTVGYSTNIRTGTINGNAYTVGATCSHNGELAVVATTIKEFQSVAETQYISGTAVVNTNAFGQPTISVGAVFITGTGISNVNTFGLPTISVGIVIISGTGITNVNSFGLPVIDVGTVTISGTGIGNTNAFGLPTISVGSVVISGTGIVNVNSFGLPTISGASPQSIISSGFLNVIIFGNPTVTRVKNRDRSSRRLPLQRVRRR
jgi:hypothetical protein